MPDPQIDPQGRSYATGKTYCNVVTEAYSCGLPIITQGIGVLGERVEHGVSGLVGKTPESFGQAAVRALTDDALWLSMHANVIEHPSIQPWSVRAEQWEKAFLR